MVKITKQWLLKRKACREGVVWVEKQKETDIFKLIDLAIKTNDKEILKYANWGVIEILKNERVILVKYAVYAAKQVLSIYEEKYPKDKRPRKAIQAAERYVKNPTEKNNAANAAYAAYAADAANAAYAAAYAAYAAYAADAAYAANAAAYAANAANAAAYAANAAAYAANAAADAAAYAAAWNKMLIKILRYGKKLIKEAPK